MGGAGFEERSPRTGRLNKHTCPPASWVVGSRSARRFGSGMCELGLPELAAATAEATNSFFSRD